jgi:hypothetical protein
VLDHLVLATPSLADTVAELVRRGLPLVPGGAHVGRGTRNHLAALGGGSYLEVVGPDIDQPEPDGPRPFGVDDLDRARLVAWCARPADRLDDVVSAWAAAGHDAGPITAMSRRRPDGLLLSWRLTAPIQPALPFLIDWLDSPHPSATLPPTSHLVTFTVVDPDPVRTRALLAAVGEQVDVVEGPTELRAVVASDGVELVL